MRAAILTAVLLVLPAAASACVLEFAYTNQASPPFVTAAAPDESMPGLAVEIVRAAAADVGCKAVFVRLPGKRVLAETVANRHAGALMFSHNDDRARQLVFPMLDGAPDPARRLARLTYYIYRPLGGEVYWDGKKLTGLQRPIGTNLGYAVADELRAKGAKVEEVPSAIQNLDKLRMGRIGAYAMHEYGVDGLLKAPRYANIEKLSLPFSSRDYFLVFSKSFYSENKELAERLWQEMVLQRDLLMRERLTEYVN